MFLLHPTGFGQWLENNKFSITGFVEGGYFLDTNNPNSRKDQPTLIGFPGPFSDHVLLDQADLTLSKAIDSTKSWDWGFTFENGFGTDDSFIHSVGMLDNRPPGDPQNQYDIPQANVEVLVPLGTGLTIEAGKFLAFLSNEVINPTGNAFFTHSYNFLFGVPFTNTGVTGSYTFPKLMNGNDLTVTAGATEGWNQSLRDANGAIDFLGQAKSNLTLALSWIFNLEIGPQALPVPRGFPQNHGNYETDAELILTDNLSSELTVTGDFLYGDFPNEGAVGRRSGTVPSAMPDINSAPISPSICVVNGTGTKADSRPAPRPIIMKPPRACRSIRSPTTTSSSSCRFGRKFARISRIGVFMISRMTTAPEITTN